jgi:predicted nucleic acid-binding protein
VIAYVDTSAAVKFLVDERESNALTRWEEQPDVVMVSSDLLVAELNRFQVRNPRIGQTDVLAVLAMIIVEPIDRRDYFAAGRLAGPHLRSLDALHLRMAQKLAVDAVVTYDIRMIDAAHSLGIPVLSPGLSS